jgi:hypothetical protein
MFERSTPHTFNLKHYGNEAEFETKSSFVDNIAPIVMIAIGAIGIYLFFIAS